MALGDDVKKLQETVTTLLVRISQTDKAADALYASHSDTARIVADLRREHEKEIALLKQDIQNRCHLLNAEHEREIVLLKREIEELKSWKADQKKEGEERSRRLWAFGPSLLGAVVGGLIAAGIAYLIPRN